MGVARRRRDGVWRRDRGGHRAARAARRRPARRPARRGAGGGVSAADRDGRVAAQRDALRAAHRARAARRAAPAQAAGGLRRAGGAGDADARRGPAAARTPPARAGGPAPRGRRGRGVRARPHAVARALLDRLRPAGADLDERGRPARGRQLRLDLRRGLPRAVGPALPPAAAVRERGARGGAPARGRARLRPRPRGAGTGRGRRPARALVRAVPRAPAGDHGVVLRGPAPARRAGRRGDVLRAARARGGRRRGVAPPRRAVARAGRPVRARRGGLSDRLWLHALPRRRRAGARRPRRGRPRGGGRPRPRARPPRPRRRA